MSDAVLDKPAAVAEQADWAQFDPWRAPEREEPQEPRTVNTITISCAAKKIMAAEWRRARGIRKRDPRVAQLEGAAKEHEARSAERQQEERRRVTQLEQEQGKILDCLDGFVDAMLDKKERNSITSLEDVADLMAAAFADLGEVLDVTWDEDGGCAVWIDPWPDKRKRRARGGVRRALRRLSLDRALDVVAYEPVTDPAVRQQKRTDILLRAFQLGGKEIAKLRTPEAARDLLAEKAWEIGRTVGVTSDNGQWKVRLQPWEDVRAHNLDKSSKKPIAEYEIAVSKDFRTVSCYYVEG